MMGTDGGAGADVWRCQNSVDVRVKVKVNDRPSR